MVAGKSLVVGTLLFLAERPLDKERDKQVYGGNGRTVGQPCAADAVEWSAQSAIAIMAVVLDVRPARYVHEIESRA